MSDDMTRAMMRVAKNAPYLYSTVLAMEKIEDKRCPSMGVDMHYRIYYNPEWIKTRTPDANAYTIIHEWAHAVRSHGKICQTRGYDKKLWNIAGDLSINQMEFNEVKYPGDGIHPSDSQFNFPLNLMEEEYYKLLLQKQEEEQDDGDGESDGDGDGDGSGSGGGGGYSDGQDEGSGATGESAPWESKNAPQLNPVQVQAQIQGAADAIANEVAKGQGNVPAGLELWANQFNKPHIDWRKRLSTVMFGIKRTGTGRIDHSRHRKRRIGGRTMFFPRQRSIKPCVTFVIDTSGSMLDGSLEAGLSEVYGALGNAVVKVVWCDTQADGPHPVKTKMDLMRPVGGGGSDMSDGIHLAEEDNPALIITITDGLVSWPSKCKTNHLAVIIDGNEGPNFGDTIKIRKKSNV